MIDPNRSQTGVQDVVTRISQYGIDDSGPRPDEQIHTVDVPETLCLLPVSVKQSFLDSLQDVVNIDEALITTFMNS